jgi:hypothetical protein
MFVNKSIRFVVFFVSERRTHASGGAVVFSHKQTSRCEILGARGLFFRARVRHFSAVVFCSHRATSTKLSRGKSVCAWPLRRFVPFRRLRHNAPFSPSPPGSSFGPCCALLTNDSSVFLFGLVQNPSCDSCSVATATCPRYDIFRLLRPAVRQLTALRCHCVAL